MGKQKEKKLEHEVTFQRNRSLAERGKSKLRWTFVEEREAEGRSSKQQAAGSRKEAGSES